MKAQNCNDFGYVCCAEIMCSRDCGQHSKFLKEIIIYIISQRNPLDVFESWPQSTVKEQKKSIIIRQTVRITRCILMFLRIFFKQVYYINLNLKTLPCTTGKICSKISIYCLLILFLHPF